MPKSLKAQSMITTLSVLSILILLLSACNTPNNVQVPGNKNVVRGGIWTDELSQDPDSLIPNGALKRVSFLVDQALYAPLFYGDVNGTIHPGLTTELPSTTNGGISSDLKTWTFHLRPHLVWSDGIPLDANDVNFTWKLWTNPLFGASSTFGLNLIQSAPVSSDNLTIVFHLKQPFAPFISAWVDGLVAPLPAHHFSHMAPDQILRSADNLNPSVTSGPFMMVESMPGNHYTVMHNAKYYRASEGLPYLDKVIFRIVPDATKALSDFQGGKADSGWFTNLTNLANYQRLKNYKFLTNMKSTNFEAIYFNFHNPILAQNVSVRKAIALAIDYQALIKTARNGQAVRLCTDNSAALNPGYQANAPCPKFDSNAANTLLDQNGWVKKADGYRSKGGQKLEFKYSATTDNAWGVADARLVQKNLQAIGIQLDIQNYSALTFYSSLLPNGKPGTYDIAEFESALNYDADDSAMLSCSQIPPNGFNIDFYCNKALDVLYRQEQATADSIARQKVFDQIHHIDLTQFPFIVLYSPFGFAMVKNGTHNDFPGPQGALETINIWTWWCDGGHCPA